MLALAALFFCSGASALIYQVLWIRVLGWVFGVTVYAVSTVWASFMAGLAAGSLLAGIVADRVRRPLLWFGIAELLVGATALSTPFMFDWLQRAYVAAYPSLAHSLAALTAARFAIAVSVLIVPTAMMGATLPLVIKSSELSGGALGSHVAVLYGSNTAGAIVGTLAAGLYFIPALGIRWTFFVAAALNLMVGVCAIAIAGIVDRGAEALRHTDRDRKAEALCHTQRDRGAGLQACDPDRADRTFDAARRLVLAVFALSGFVSLALEVVWFRVLTLFLRPTVYGFAVMLATILGGIAVGSYITTVLLNRRYRWIAVLASLEVALALAIILSFRPLASLPALSERLTPVLSPIMPAYLVYPLSGSLLAIFPSALLMGIAFPIGLRVWAGTGRNGSSGIAERIGQFYSLNVAGAIAGSLAAGFLLLPAFGSRTSIAVLAALTFASGLALLALSEWRRTSRFAIGASATALFVLLAVKSPDPFDQFIAQRYRAERILWREEGIESTVVVHQARGGRLSLTVNGNHQASTDAGTAYIHRRIGHLPMALHPDPKTALVIGLGGGATAGAVSVHGPDVDVVELSSAVVHGAQFFDAINYSVLSRPNVRLRVDDGRNYMMLTPRRYDVVTADVIHTIYAGSGNLYSKEYFDLMRRVLNPGGMAVQWIAGTDAEYKIIARTFLSVFPDTTVWGDGSLLVGTIGPLRLRRSHFERKLGDVDRAQGLHDLNIESFDALLAAFRAGPDELRTFVGHGPLLTDDKPVVEYFLSLPRDRDVDTSSLKGSVSAFVDER